MYSVIVLLITAFFFIKVGVYLRDFRIRRIIEDAASRSIGHHMFLVGDSVNYIYCLSILDNKQLEAFFEALPESMRTK